MRYKMISNDVNNRTFGMYPYVWWDNAFPNEELDNVVNYFTDTCDENLMSGKTFSSGDEKHDEIRRSKIAFVNKDAGIKTPKDLIGKRVGATVTAQLPGGAKRFDIHDANFAL